MRGMQTFLRDDKGSQTVEFVLWLPIIASLMVIITDSSILYLTQTEMSNVARDTARRLSSGQLQTENAAVIYANQQLNLYDPAYVVTATRDATSSMTVVITVDVVDATIFGYFLTPVLGSTMESRVVMRSDPSLALAAAGGGGTGGGNGGGNGNGNWNGNGNGN
jgi:Flp pilus assembly protein TadG